MADRAAVDARARQVLARLAPLSFAVAAADERDAVLRMRYDCVVAEGWATPADHPDGRERDEYDDGATFVVCRDGADLIGCMRVVPPAPGRPLPTERDFGIRARPEGGVAEAGRIVVAPAARPGRSHLVLGGLAACGWLEALAGGWERVVSTATADLVDLYAGLGLRVSVLGPPRLSWGERRVPIAIDAGDEAFSFLDDASGRVRR